MVDQVWISEVLSNGELGNKLGLRQKWYGEPWEAPYVNFAIPRRSERVRAAIFKYAAGNTMTREEMPEASAVYNMTNFKQVVKDKPVRIHPLVSQLVDPAVLEKMKVRPVGKTAEETGK